MSDNEEGVTMGKGSDTEIENAGDAVNDGQAAEVSKSASAEVSTSAASSEASADDKRVIDVVSLYPRDMNIYGDSGNVLAIRRRLSLYGYEPVVHFYNQGDAWPEHVDMILGGGGQDTGQKKIIRDLFKRANIIRDLASDGVPMLMICGLYQLFGEYFETIDGDKLPGIGVLGAYTIGKSDRLIGNLVETTDKFDDIIGYENHSGQTFLREETHPLGYVNLEGTGNNGEDNTEGARTENVIGTYMHGSLLPKNPQISDFLIAKACEQRYGVFEPRMTVEDRAELDQLDRYAAEARKVAVARPR